VVLVYQDFSFYWPPFVRDLLSGLSLLNFNIDILSPECSVSGTPSQRYIMKVFFPLLLPLTFLLLHLLSYVQRAFVDHFGSGFEKRFPEFCSLTKEREWSASGLRYSLSLYFTQRKSLDWNKTVNTMIMLVDLLYVSFLPTAVWR
jgi:hypothetical protein